MTKWTLPEDLTNALVYGPAGDDIVVANLTETLKENLKVLSSGYSTYIEEERFSFVFSIIEVLGWYSTEDFSCYEKQAEELYKKFLEVTLGN